MKYYSFNKSGIKAFAAWLTETREEINRDLFNLQKMATEAGQKAWVKHINYWKKAQPYEKYIEQELEALGEHESQEDFERYQFLQMADVSHTQVMIEREYEALYALAAKAQK